MRPHLVDRRILTVAVGAILSVTLAACGGSSTAAKATTTPSSLTPAESRSQVTTDWVAFFSAKTPVARRVELLQNGPDFASVIKTQAGSPLASTATAKVAAVTLESSSQAKVAYSILVGGTSALPHQTGTAVYQSGTWKVGDTSFCALLSLENGGKTEGLPAACTAAK